MQAPPEIIFHDMDRSQWVEDYVHERLAHLEKFAQGMTSAHITLTCAQRSRQTGNVYSVMVQVRLPPNHDLAAKKEGMVSDPQVELRTLIRETFDKLARQVKETADRRRNEVKRHGADVLAEGAPQFGMVEALHDGDYGFIRTVDDNRQVYFHRNSVLHDAYDRLAVGTQVRFESEEGEKGLQATSVQIVDKPGVRT